MTYFASLTCQLNKHFSESIASKTKLKICHTKLFISHSFSNNDSISTQSMIWHS